MGQEVQQILLDGAIVLGRIVTILPLLLVMTIFMGRRSIGELPIFDFLVITSLGAIAGADIADPNIPHIHTAVAIVAVAILQIVVSRLMIRYRSFGRLITFEPTLVVHDGKLLTDNLRRVRYSIDNILRMMREADVFDLADIEMAILESNGKLSILKKSAQQAISFPVVVEGRVYQDVLQAVKVDEGWLQQQLARRGVTDMNAVFYAAVTEKQELHVSLQQESAETTPPLHH